MIVYRDRCLVLIIPIASNLQPSEYLKFETMNSNILFFYSTLIVVVIVLMHFVCYYCCRSKNRYRGHVFQTGNSLPTILLTSCYWMMWLLKYNVFQLHHPKIGYISPDALDCFQWCFSSQYNMALKRKLRHTFKLNVIFKLLIKILWIWLIRRKVWKCRRKRNGNLWTLEKYSYISVLTRIIVQFKSI